MPGLDGLNAIISRWTASPLVEDAFLNTVSGYTVNGTVAPPNGDWGGSDFCEDFSSGNNWGFEAIYAASAQQLLTDYYENRGGRVPEVRVGVLDSCFGTRHPDLNLRRYAGSKSQSIPMA